MPVTGRLDHIVQVHVIYSDVASVVDELGVADVLLQVLVLWKQYDWHVYFIMMVF